MKYTVSDLRQILHNKSYDLSNLMNILFTTDRESPYYTGLSTMSRTVLNNFDILYKFESENVDSGLSQLFQKGIQIIYYLLDTNPKYYDTLGDIKIIQEIYKLSEVSIYSAVVKVLIAILGTIIRFTEYLDAEPGTEFIFNRIGPYIRGFGGLIYSGDTRYNKLIRRNMNRIFKRIHESNIIFDNKIYITDQSIKDAIAAIGNFQKKTFVKIALCKNITSKNSLEELAQLLELDESDPIKIICEYSNELFIDRYNRTVKIYQMDEEYIIDRIPKVFCNGSYSHFLI